MCVQRRSFGDFDILCSDCGVRLATQDAVAVELHRAHLDTIKCPACAGPVPLLSPEFEHPDMEGVKVVEIVCSKLKNLQMKIDYMKAWGWELYILDEAGACAMTRVISRSEWKKNKDEVRVIVSGTKGFANKQFVFAKLDHLFQNVEAKDRVVISGMCAGPNEHGHEWATNQGLVPLEYYADWNNIDVPGAINQARPDGSEYNAKAGSDKNLKMAIDGRATHLVAFWDGRSRNTKNMISIAETLGLTVCVIRYDQVFQS